MPPLTTTTTLSDLLASPWIQPLLAEYAYDAMATPSWCDPKRSLVTRLMLRTKPTWQAYLWLRRLHDRLSPVEYDTDTGDEDDD